MNRKTRIPFLGMYLARSKKLSTVYVALQEVISKLLYQRNYKICRRLSLEGANRVAFGLACNLVLGMGACAGSQSGGGTDTKANDLSPDDGSESSGSESNSSVSDSDEDLLRVMGVEVAGNPGSYSFSVTLSSPDTGCMQYADWWEVVLPPDRLVFRRILAHSHVHEQPFTRSGGPVEIQAEDRVIVRGHMNSSGYSPFVMQGSVAGGFEFVLITDDDELFPNPNIEEQEPQPNPCES